MAQADWTITNRLPFDAAWRDPAAAWVNADYFRFYQEVEGEPWFAFFVRSYLTYNPIRKNRNYGHGYVLIQDRECYEVADCTGDGATDLRDLAVFARFYHAAQSEPNTAV